MTNFELAHNFPQSSYTQWQALVEKGLKGADLASLAGQTEDGLTRAPLSTAKDRPEHIAPLPRADTPLLSGRAWHITAPMRDPDIAYANHQALEDLMDGASALRMSLNKNAANSSNSITGGGINISSHNDIKRLLDQVLTDLVPIVIAPHNNPAVIDDFKDYRSAHIFLGLCPSVEGLDKLSKTLPPLWQLVTINAAHMHDIGATYAQELAFFAAGATKVFRSLGPDAARHISAEFAADQDGHMTIAKLRAARRIYARIAESFGAKDAQLSLHIISSHRMMQSVDPWTNMLRVMSAGFGAVIGGADFITLRPFTDAIGHAAPFGYRAARNMQLMMMEESHLGQVQDAAYGSYFHENMTQALAKTAWTQFQTLEAEGGFDNLAPFMARILTASQAREAVKAPVLGVTLHPLEKDNPAYREAKTRSLFETETKTKRGAS